jgi:hypothetical protein
MDHGDASFERQLTAVDRYGCYVGMLGLEKETKQNLHLVCDATSGHVSASQYACAFAVA